MSAEVADRPQAVPADVTHEILSQGGLSLGQAARKFPSYRQDRPVSPSTVWRWITEGARLADGSRVRLEAARVSGRWLTSEKALIRFIRTQTPRLGDDAPTRSDPLPSAAADRAAAELKSIGI